MLSTSHDWPFPDFLERLRKEDGEAARFLVKRFGAQLIGLARQHLDTRLRSKVDADDLMQSVLECFFRSQREKVIPLRNWDDLWSLLKIITQRQCGHRVSYYHRERRDIRRECVSLDEGQEGDAFGQAVARGPTPLEELMYSETVEAIMQKLNGRDQLIAAFAFQGYTRLEIAERVGCTERTVYRVLGRLRRRLQHSINSAD